MIRRTQCVRYGIRLLCLMMLIFTTMPSVLEDRVKADAYYSWMASPQGDIGVSKPEIITKISIQNMKIQNYSMVVNEGKVPVSYVYDEQETTHLFRYIPSEKLQPGIYTVRFTFNFEGYQPTENSWSFTVASNADDNFPAPNEKQRNALDAINDYRKILGLKAVTLDERLNASATAHAKYQAWNDEFSHGETKGKKGFTGESVLQRTQYYGYTNKMIYEDISKQTNESPEDAVDGLFDAPYHRIPFLHPDLEHIGYGKEGSFHVIHFGVGGAGNGGEKSESLPRLVVSPSDKDPLVPAAWYGNEIPDPLRNHNGAEYPVGFPIVIGLYDDNIKQVSIVFAHMTDSRNQGVHLLWNSSGNKNKDEMLTSEVVLIPKEALEKAQKYSVKLKLLVTYQDGTTALVEKEWSFAAEKTVGLSKQKLHENVEVYLSLYDSLSQLGSNSIKQISFGLAQSFYVKDGTRVEMRVPPVVVNGTSYLYIRDLADALDAEVAWDQQKRAAIYKKGDRTVTLFTDINIYKVNQTAYPTSTPARLISGQTMVPVRILAELLDSKVSYDKVTNTVKISFE